MQMYSDIMYNNTYQVVNQYCDEIVGKITFIILFSNRILLIYIKILVINTEYVKIRAQVVIIFYNKMTFETRIFTNKNKNIYSYSSPNEIKVTYNRAIVISLSNEYTVRSSMP